VINPIELIEQFGLDQMRYFMCRAVPFGNDGNFARSGMINHMNADLANTIGNLVQRSLSMIQKNCEAKLPSYKKQEPEDRVLLTMGYEQGELYKNYCEAMEQYRFHDAIKVILDIASAANEYMDAQAPWQLKKEDPERMQAVLYTVAETVRSIAILLQPFTPTAANAILDQLMVSQEHRSFEALDAFYALEEGTILPKPQGVFPRYVEQSE
jgi:methionyl-tRNA synthetase